MALVNSVNPVRLAGPEDRRLRDRRLARRRPRLPPAAGRQRRQHLGVLAGLRAVRRPRPRHPAAGDARLPGRGGGAAGDRRAVPGPRDQGDRDPDRQPRLVEARRGGRATSPAAGSPPSPTRRSSPRSASSPATTASSSSRPPRPASPACSQELAAGETYAGATVSITVTGHGLKDTATALEGFAGRRPRRHRRGRRRGRRRRGRRARLTWRPSSTARSGSRSRPPRPTSGPGFDALGLALSLRDELEAEVVAERARRRGRRRGRRRRAPRRVPPRRARDAGGLRGDGGAAARPAPVLPQRDPARRGLGSSSAAIVAGVALARALVAGGALLIDDDGAVDLAADVEGHPDNVAPALLGGFVISGREDGGWYAVRAGRRPAGPAVVFVPPTRSPPRSPGACCPAPVPHADAAANAGRAALLVAALAGPPEQLLAATRDYLHQDYRAPAMPASLALVERAARRRASRRRSPVPGRPCWPSPTARHRPPLGRPARACWPAAPTGWSAHALERRPARRRAA